MRMRDRNNYTDLLELLAEPELFVPEQMPVGSDYLGSPAETIFDYSVGACVLPFAGPIAMVGGLAVKSVDHAPAIFRQLRVGYLGRHFMIAKLTTMPGAATDTHSNGRHDDPRRSELGKVLSRLRADETLNLYNVAKREMSIIGPRPLLPGYLQNVRTILGNKPADEWIKTRSLALPGIFDEFSTMHHGGEVEDDEEIRLQTRVEVESRYILETASVKEDLRVLAKTFGLFGETLKKMGTEVVASGLAVARYKVTKND